MAISRPADRELDHEFDGFDDHMKDGDLAAARADLRAAVVTERRFDRQLIALSFPPRTEPFVRLLYRVNQARAELTSTAAGVTSLRELRGYQRRLDAANEPVEDAGPGHPRSARPAAARYELTAQLTVVNPR
jgi:DNA-binding GntR family transcriptional regulator